MDAFLRDISYSLRRLRKSPAFTAIVVVTLALGIGANTAIFSVVNTVLLRALPYRTPEALVSIEHFYPSLNSMEAPVSARGFRDYRDKTSSFESVAVETQFGANLTGSGDPERVPGVRVSGDWFHTLGVAPLSGRVLTRDDDEPGHEHVVVLSHGIWTRLFAASPSAVGKIDRAERRDLSDRRRDAVELPQLLRAERRPVRSACSQARRVHRRLHQRVPELRRAPQAGHGHDARTGGDDDVCREPEEGKPEQLRAHVDAQGSQSRRSLERPNSTRCCWCCSAPSASYY